MKGDWLLQSYFKNTFDKYLVQSVFSNETGLILGDVEEVTGCHLGHKTVITYIT